MTLYQHNYMTYKKESSLGYYAEIRPKALINRVKIQQDDAGSNGSNNNVYQTMKSYSKLRKVRGESYDQDDQPRKKTRIKVKSQHDSNSEQKLPTLSSYLHSSMPPRCGASRLKPIIKSTSSSIIITPTPNQNISSLSFSPSPSSLSHSLPHAHSSPHPSHHHTRLHTIITSTQQIRLQLHHNKPKIALITKYNKLIDRYLDRIPSPTTSVTREKLKENLEFDQFCKEQIYLEMDRDNPKNQSKLLGQLGVRSQFVHEFREPLLPGCVVERLVRNNKTELKDKHNREETKKADKLLIRTKFLSMCKDNRFTKKLEERSKSLCRIHNFDQPKQTVL